MASGCSRKQPNTADPDNNKAFLDSMRQRQIESEPVVLVEDNASIASPGEIDEQLTEQEKEVLDSKTEMDFDLDVRETREFENYFTYFTHKKPKMFQAWLKRSEAYMPYVRRLFREKGLPDDLILLPFAESGYNPWAYSRAHAAGMWQFIPGTGRKFDLTVNWWVDERRDPYKATEAAAAYLQDLYDLFGDWYLALAAYNAGEGKIARALRRSDTEDYFELCDVNHRLSYRVRLRRETKNYVPKFLAIVKIVSNLEKLGFEPMDWDRELQVHAMKAPPGTDLRALAEHCGMSWKEFRKLNPHFRRMFSPPYGKTDIYVPKNKIAEAEAWLKTPEAQPYAGYQRYRIRRGDSWWRISRRFGIPISVLKRVNNHHSNTLHPGRSIMIPGAKGIRTADTPPSRKRSYALKRSNYIVRRGDTLWSISRHFGLSLDTLCEANGLTGREILHIGQKIYVPDGSAKETELARREAQDVKRKLVRYRVRRGDTLIHIARRFGVSTSALKRWNDRRSSRIYAGELLKVYVH